MSEERENTKESGSSSGTKSVQKSSTSAPLKKDDTWRWTKKKRKAVRLVVRGLSDTKIAEELGVHRHSIRKWKEVQEFIAACVTEAKEYTQRTRFKRVYEAGVFTDQYGTQLVRLFQSINKQKDGPNQTQLNALATMQRGYDAMRGHERVDFGDNVQKVAGHISFSGAGAVDPTAGAAGAQSFKRFLVDHMEQIPRGLISAARNPGEALVLATRVLVQHTDVLEKLHEEEQAADNKDKEDKRG